ncbi:MAG: hypothetical protein JWR19_2611 [Pedosphaera sp.]|nr:hypothetical protein [Pedosphaera sp.]
MNSEPSGDEHFVFIFSIVVALGLLGAYYACLLRAATLGCPTRQRRPLQLTPPAALLVLLFVLLRYADSSVRSSAYYLILFMALGAGWMLAAAGSFLFFGVSLREDAIEQRNPAAIVAVTGGMLAVMLAYAGGNIGAGPTIWTTIFSSFLATTALLLLWLLLQGLSNITRAIIEERDMASGVRLAGYLVALSLILGRAVAGDWHSTEATMRDFVAEGWPALALTLLLPFSERWLQPSLKRPFPSVRIYGIIPAASSLLFALGVVLYLGKWN